MARITGAMIRRYAGGVRQILHVNQTVAGTGPGEATFTVSAGVMKNYLKCYFVPSFAAVPYDNSEGQASGVTPSNWRIVSNTQMAVTNAAMGLSEAWSLSFRGFIVEHY